MPKKFPPGDRLTPFVTGGDWSVGLNSPTFLHQAEVLAVLGRGLQSLNDDVIQDGVPEHLSVSFNRLHRKEEK